MSEDGAREVINRMALEDRDEQYMLDVVAPLAAKLCEGKNYVNAEQYSDLLEFFGEDSDDALDAGRFMLYGDIEIIRVRPVTRMTVAQLAKKAGMPHNSMKRLIAKSGLKPEMVGSRKYYNINSLAPFLKQIATPREV